jgi:hypothetical protein
LHGAALLPRGQSVLTRLRTASRDEVRRCWHCVQQPNVRDAAIAAGWTAERWKAAGHRIDPYVDWTSGGHWTVDPYASLAPPQVVAASAPRPPAGPREAAHARPACPLQPRTLAARLLSLWLAPLTANKAPAQSALLVVGQSAWSPVVKAQKTCTFDACLSDSRRSERCLNCTRCGARRRRSGSTRTDRDCGISRRRCKR